MGWQTKRRDPYTSVGIRRLGCIRCGEEAAHQWQICSDGNNYRPVCLQCDIALNRLVLEWFGHPNVGRLVDDYRAKQGAA